jgi:hypothetical protein
MQIPISDFNVETSIDHSVHHSTIGCKIGDSEWGFVGYGSTSSEAMKDACGKMAFAIYQYVKEVNKNATGREQAPDGAES